MPLHLLGKKSWNVYNQENIAKVRRDEAEAQAQEDELDRRTQAVDAERRLQRLRGEAVDDLPGQDDGHQSAISRRHDQGPSRKRRRVAGEDDTDRDIRLARDELVPPSTKTPVLSERHEPLTDAKGNINLFPEGSGTRQKNAEAEAEKSMKKREHEDQYTMRFSNAAGIKQSLGAPWYSTFSQPDNPGAGKNVWGKADEGRRGRDKLRTDANDPLATMKRGVKQLRDVERGRKNWVKERERELQELKTLQRSTRTKHRHSRTGSMRGRTQSLENSDLDRPPEYRERETSGHSRQWQRHSLHRRRHHGDVLQEPRLRGDDDR